MTRDHRTPPSLTGVHSSDPAEEITEFASITTTLTVAVAGSRRLLIRPASSMERDGQLLTWSAIGRCGIGVGSQIARLWTRRSSTNQRISHGFHSITKRWLAFDASNPSSI